MTRAESRTRFVPGQPDMWAFVPFEALVFTVYVVRRTQDADAA